MVIEVRKYKIKHGLRDRFLDLFEKETVPLQQSLGMRIVGPFLDLEDPDVFIWMRGFPSLAERERMKAALYEGDKWKRELEHVALPLLESYEVVLTEMPPVFFNDLQPEIVR